MTCCGSSSERRSPPPASVVSAATTLASLSSSAGKGAVDALAGALAWAIGCWIDEVATLAGADEGEAGCAALVMGISG
ncbi:hypothetical protein GCM10027065_13950 [Rhodanobacter koreensis]